MRNLEKTVVLTETMEKKLMQLSLKHKLEGALGWSMNSVFSLYGWNIQNKTRLKIISNLQSEI